MIASTPGMAIPNNGGMSRHVAHARQRFQIDQLPRRLDIVFAQWQQVRSTGDIGGVGPGRGGNGLRPSYNPTERKPD
jgi:hypothetical protein